MDRQEYQIMYTVEDTLWWYRGMKAISRAVIERFYPRRAAVRILDAGCGTGGAMMHLEDYGLVTGVDHMPYALQLSRERGASRVVAASVACLPFFKSASFDVVTSWDVLTLLRSQEDEAAMHEMARVLVEGGRLFLREPAYDWLRGAHDRAWEMVHRYALSEVKLKLERAGLAVEHLSHANMWLLPVAIAKRMIEPLLPAQNGSDLTLDVGPLNGIFRAIVGSEAPLAARFRLPCGLSIIAVSRKRERGSTRARDAVRSHDQAD